MAFKVTEVAIHPIREDEEEGWCNTEGEGEEDGWNVHVFGRDGAEGGIIEDVDFEDYESAWDFALAMSEKYGVGIDHRY